MSKSIKFKNNTFLDSTSIVNGTTTLNNELTNMKNETNTRIKHYDNSSSSSNLNDYITTGIYQLGKSYSNAPVTSTLYGTLVVLTSRSYAWSAGDYSNWIWQLIFTGYGIWMRQSSNSNTWGGWIQISTGTPNGIEQMTDKYTKYTNGLMIQYFQFTINASISSAWGSGFEVQVTSGTFPVTFKKIYSCQITPSGRACFVEYSGATVERPMASGWLYRPTSDNGAKYDYVFDCIAVGTWK